MTNKRSRLGRLERIADLQLEARARRVLGLGEGSAAWAEIAREYREISEPLEAIRAKHGIALPDMESEARILARELGLDLEELMAEAEHIADRGSLDRQAVSWLLSNR